MVSIGIPTYNRCEYLIRAVESALKQTYRELEIIISDNASTDNTVERVESLSDPRIVFLKQPTNLGLIGNFNACLQAATGEFFLLLSDDDVLDPTCIEKLREALASPTTGVAWCPAKILDAKGVAKYTSDPGPEEEPGWALVEAFFHGDRGVRLCSIMVRRKDAIDAGGYREEYGPICDLGCWAQVAVSYPKAACIREPLAGYTVHFGSGTAQPDGPLWQRGGERVTANLVALLDGRGEHRIAQRIRISGRDNTSNLIAAVMMQCKGKPGWIKYWISEVLRVPQYLFAPVVFKRLLRDGWKLLNMGARS